MIPWVSILWLVVTVAWYVLAPGSAIPYVLAVILAIVWGLHVCDHRVVHEGVLLVAEFDDYAGRFTRHAMGGGGATAYHKASRTMIDIQKAVEPNLIDGAVRLTVTKLTVKHPEHFDRGWQPRWSSRRARHPVRLVAISELHSLDEGETLEKVDCGASLTRVEKAVTRMVMTDPVMADDPVFDVWRERGSVFDVWYQRGSAARPEFGKFDDEGSR